MANLKELGVAVRAYRVAAGETIEDLANAMEVESDEVSRIESGIFKPSTEIIEQIGSHFSLRENEVKRLLDLAGLDADDFEFSFDAGDMDLQKLTDQYDVMMAPIFYTDMVNVVSNQYGITINFIQNASGDDKPVVVSRVGMSHKHAESIIAVLAESLKRAQEQNQQDDNQN